MRPFLVTARTPLVSITFSTLASSSAEAAEITATLLGDQPCGITVLAGVR